MEQKIMSSFKLRREDSVFVEQITEKYKAVMNSNFERMEKELVSQLLEQAKTLKQKIGFYRKETCQENIEHLIMERRREKQKERQGLETRWRQCTESFKKLQEEQKRMTNQQKQNQFDLKNLENQIKRFKLNINNKKKRVEAIGSNERHFVTEVKENYQSPYKSTVASVQEKVLDRIEEEHKLLAKTQDFFFTKKYSNGNQLNTLQSNSKILNNEISSLGYQTNLIKVLKDRKVNGIRRNEERTWQEEVCRDENMSNLSNFLSDRDIRLKIFRFLKKQI